MNSKITEQQQNLKDPVCGMEVSRSATNEGFEYQGKAYYFCCGSCKAKFEAEPEKYIPQAT